ncbi:hypothetical protein [Pararhodobacter sp.]|uniref:hypothetical protein n=1 Tax=Pararhodobacter sp. TaxID=2127056 RepID=UPI002AFF4093|nr:hypothetical protein [Pararhodobacter sp.]
MGEAFLGWLLDLGWVYFGPALTFLILSTFFYRGLWEHDGDRKAAMARLTASSFHQAYRAGMERVLAGMDTRPSSAELAHGMGPGRVAFSSGLLQRMMLLAVAYPIVMLIGQWLVLGTALVLGGVELAPVGSTLARGYVALWIIAIIGVLIWVARSQWRWKSLVAATAIVSLTSGGQILSNNFDVPSVVADADAVAFAVAFAVATVIESREGRNGPVPGLWLWYLAVLALVLATVVATRSAITGQDTLVIIAFFGFFPILNAVADFASVGLTRYLLRRGLNGVTIWNAILDVLGGLLIFFLLGFAAITLFHVIHPRDGVRLIDLPGLFEGLRHSPGDNWWLAVMLGSTLLPTVLHAMIGMFTVLTRYPVVLRDRVVALLRDDLPSNRKWGTAAYCVMVTLSIWVPIWALVALFSVNHGAVLRGVIVVFEGYARMIGAL